MVELSHKLRGDVKMNRSRIIALSMLGAGIALVVCALVFDAADDVMAKAVRICLECIGIG